MKQISDGTIANYVSVVREILQVVQAGAKIIGAILVMIAIYVGLVEILIFKKNTEERLMGLIAFGDLAIGSFVLGAIGIILGFLVASLL